MCRHPNAKPEDTFGLYVYRNGLTMTAFCKVVGGVDSSAGGVQMDKNPDLVALDKVRDALWGDPDEYARPSPEEVAPKVLKRMLGKNLSFQEACLQIAAEAK